MPLVSLSFDFVSAESLMVFSCVDGVLMRTDGKIVITGEIVFCTHI